jgi:hypothetical protein
MKFFTLNDLLPVYLKHLRINIYGINRDYVMMSKEGSGIVCEIKKDFSGIILYSLRVLKMISRRNSRN